MKLDDFYKKVEGFTLFPGSIMELTAYYGAKAVPVKNQNIFITGIIIPSRSEISDVLGCHQSGIASFGEFVTQQGIDDLLSEAQNEFANKFSLLKAMLEKMYENQDLQDTDIRVKAKALGADAVVHFQLYDAKNTMYMGIPVKGSDRTLHFL